MENNDKTSESTEPDTPEVSSRTAQGEETLPSSKAENERRVFDFIKRAFKDSLTSLVKDKIFILSLLAGLLTAAVLLSYPPLHRLFSNEASYDAESTSQIVYVVSASLDEGHHVKFKLFVLFRDTEEKADLMRKLPKIKHALQDSGNLPGLAKAIQEKDLRGLKTHIINTVSDLTGLSVKSFGLKELSLN